MGWFWLTLSCIVIVLILAIPIMLSGMITRRKKEEWKR